MIGELTNLLEFWDLFFFGSRDEFIGGKFLGNFSDDGDLSWEREREIDR